VARDGSQGILGFIGLVALSAVLGFGAWKVITRPKERPGQRAVRREPPANDSLGFISVAGEGVDLEIVAPDGSRTSTNGASTGPGRVPRSDATVDCPGFSAPGGRESECTASIHLGAPAPGDYTIIARAADARVVVLNVGWATASEVLRGAFDVRVQVSRGGASAFTIIASRDAVSRRSEPRPYTP
jgi:hypothetical protein